MFVLSPFELSTVIQLAYFALVWSAVVMLLLRPFVEIALKKWIPTTYPIPSRSMFLVRTLALTGLVIPTFLLPALDIKGSGNSQVIFWAELSSLVVLAIVAVSVSRITISKLFELIGYWGTHKSQQHEISENSKPRPVRLGHSARIKLLIITSVMFALVMIGIRLFISIEPSEGRIFIDVYNSFLSPLPYAKSDWLSLAEAAILIFLTFLLYKFISASDKNTPDELNIVFPPPTLAIRFVYFLLAVATVAIGLFLPV